MKSFLKKYERHLSAGALLLGFILDSLTLTRIDRLYDNIVVITYLTLAGFGIFLVNLYEEGVLEARIFRFFHSVFPIIIQFAFGGLFSAFTVFYSRSTTISGSWPFLLMLVGLLIGNEFLKKHYRRLTLQISILYFVLYTYLIFAIPILIGKINSFVFILSGLAGLLVIYYYRKLFIRYTPILYSSARTAIFSSIILIFITVNTLYFLNYIPPIPLSIQTIGVYHNVKRTSDGYLIEYEKRPWYKRLWFDPVYHKGEYEDVFVFSSVYAPVDLKTSVVHVWEKYNESTDEWVVHSRVPFTVTGGRLEGFRGYSIKSNPDEGSWRVRVTTERGQIIGEIKFTVENSNETLEIVRETVV